MAPSRPAVPADASGGLADPIEAIVAAVLAGTGLFPDPGGAGATPPTAPDPTPDRLSGPGVGDEPGIRFPFPPLSVAGGPPEGALAGLTPGIFAGFGTGTVYHTDAALSGEDPDSGEHRLTDIELGFSGAVFSSAALPARTNELRRPLSPALAPANGYGVGNAAEVGFNNPPDRRGQFELDDKSEAKAPPSGEPVSKNLTKVELDPVTDADLLRSSAAARAAGTGCVVGSDLAYGLGEFTDTRLVRQSQADAAVLSTSANQPPRGTSRSVSRTRLVTLPGRPLGLFGLLSETRQTIAPITILEGTDQELTIELAGEWVLRALSDGTRGTVSFGPDVEEPDIPLLRIFDAEGELINEFTMDALLAKEGRAIEIADGVLVTLGEDPRAIGGDELSQPLTGGTLTAAAVDVARIQVANPDGPGVSELRVGHMEAGVALPAGGIRCPDIGMVKESSPPTVKAGDSFTWTITVSNLNDCLLDNVKIVDNVTTAAGVGYEILSTSPAADRSGSTLTFSGLGPLAFGDSDTVSIRVKVADDAGADRFRDEAVATGTCGPATVGGDAAVDTPVQAAMQGRVVLEAPEVGRAAAAVAAPREILPQVAAVPPTLPRTGGDLLAVVTALAFITTGRFLRSCVRSRR
ncbi:MAG: hypothetical protein ACRD0S_02865 [Acidimicrobiales bacterium]